MKIEYHHYRIPDLYATSYPQDKGQPHFAALSLYNRKRQEFVNPFERELCVPFERGGATECRIYDLGHVYVGWSYCSVTDNFCYKTGREEAFKRAKASFNASVPY